MKPIIRVENLSKQYGIGARAEPYSTLRESLMRTVRKPVDLIRGGNGQKQPTFWALADLNFEVMPGEVVGIIGRNGAGKSTLLKVLSRITEPTKGRIELYGRVGSLLEVGTGFHPELTGRENIYLNGAILGMRRDEIAKKFDEIVDFAEIEGFLDTPVKRYSSGMYMRLAFAVAANLEPEILIVDEVLAVGDAEFQKKCLGKMKSVSEHGRTVLFVSHNMSAVQNLCAEVVYLEQGKIVDKGEPSAVIGRYLKGNEEDRLWKAWDDSDAPGNESVKLRSLRVVPQTGADEGVGIDVRTPLTIEIEFVNLDENAETNLSLHLNNQKGECVMALISESRKLRVGPSIGTLSIPGNFLNNGSYFVSVLIVRNQSVPILQLDGAISFTVADYRENVAYFGDWVGAVRPTTFQFSLNEI